MPPLYVTQQGAKLRIENNRLVVEQESETLVTVPLGHVSEVVLFGNIGLTTPAIGALLNQNVDVVFLKQDGTFRGRLSGGITPHVPIRRAQYRRMDNPDFVLVMAKGFVDAKLNHQKALLQRHNRQRQNAEIAACIVQLNDALQNVPRKTQVSSLLGVEGSASRAYFRGFRQLFDPEWKFEKRVRRPPTDPVNVLLSFGYTLLTGLANSAVQAAGLDPYAGFLHEIVYNRPALGLDLVEEFRPVADGIVLWCCHSGQVTPADFSPGPAERPVVLGEQGQRRFLQAFEQRMENRFTYPLRNVKLTMRQCIFEQARQIADRVLQGDPGYQGMGFR